MRQMHSVRGLVRQCYMSRWRQVLLPEPEGPTSAVTCTQTKAHTAAMCWVLLCAGLCCQNDDTCPGGICIVIPASTFLSGLEGYLKLQQQVTLDTYTTTIPDISEMHTPSD